MSNAKMSFELDAGKILAKLHRGACQTQPQYTFINTGILNDAAISPEEVDKNKINFDLEGGEYEIGVMFPVKDAVEHLKNLVDSKPKKTEPEKDPSNDADKTKDGKKPPEQVKPDLDKTKDDKNQPEQTKPDSDKTKIDDKKAADEQRKKDEQTPITQMGEALTGFRQKQKNDYTKNRETAGDSDKDRNTPGLDAERVQSKYAAEDKADIDALMLSAMTVSGSDAETVMRELDAAGRRFANEMKNISDEAELAKAEAIKKNHDQIKKFMEKSIDWARKFLTGYLKVFAGDDATKAITEKSIALTYVPDTYAGPFKTVNYENYQIPAMTDAEVREYKIKLLKAQQKSGKIDYNIERMCFKIAYSLDLGK